MGSRRFGRSPLSIREAIAALEALSPGLTSALVPAAPGELAEAESLSPLVPEHKDFLALAGRSTGSLVLRAGHAVFDTTIDTTLVRLRKARRKHRDATSRTPLGVSTTCQDCGPLHVVNDGPRRGAVELDDGDERLPVADSLAAFLLSAGVRELLFPRVPAREPFRAVPEGASAPPEQRELLAERLRELGFVAQPVAYQEPGEPARELWLRPGAAVLLDRSLPRGEARAPDAGAAGRLVRDLAEVVRLERA